MPWVWEHNRHGNWLEKQKKGELEKSKIGEGLSNLKLET
jgi:hypothetical protein